MQSALRSSALSANLRSITPVVASTLPGAFDQSAWPIDSQLFDTLTASSGMPNRECLYDSTAGRGAVRFAELRTALRWLYKLHLACMMVTHFTSLCSVCLG